MENGIKICVRSECNDLVIRENNAQEHLNHQLISLDQFEKRFGFQVRDEFYSFLMDERKKILSEESVNEISIKQLNELDRLWDKDLKQILTDWGQANLEKVTQSQFLIRSYWLKGESSKQISIRELQGESFKKFGEKTISFQQEFMRHIQEAEANLNHIYFVENNKIPQDGKGEFIWEDGDRFIGEYINGKREGKGEYFWANGDQYVGEYLNGKQHGKGEYVWANGDRYLGDYKNDMQHGKGEYIWTNGDRHVGDYVYNQKTGKAEYFYANGDRYSGDNIDGVKTGIGKYVWADGDQYIGEYIGNQQTGKGEYLWVNGDRYKGIYVNGQKSGKGEYIWANGDSQMEEYFQDKLIYQGEYKKADQSQVQY